MNTQSKEDLCTGCGETLEDSVWADYGLCQMCWEASCEKHFWSLDFEAIYAQANKQ